ncbi:hypothetical protein [Providencia rettgeri]|uniref:hypothetical protein n=1 Tax=Providencia rettgeri TaxID=587 RepID=UPI00235F35BC|nr:hypothetical protein [Providencia rettgeri]
MKNSLNIKIEKKPTTNKKISFNLIIFIFLILGVFVKNFEVLIPFQYYLTLIALPLFFLKIKKISLKKSMILLCLIFLSIILIMKNEIFISGDYKENINFIIYYFSLIFSIYIITNHLISNEYISLKLLTRTFIILNIVGLLGYIITLFSYNYDDIIQYWKYNVISRADIVNDFRSFIYGDSLLPRYNGFYIDPNRWAFCLLVQMIFIDHLYRNTATLNLVSKKILFILIFISLLFTNSRAGIIAALVYYILTRSKGKVLLSLLFLLISVISYLGYNPELYDIIYDKITYGISFSSTGNNLGDSRVRIDIWYNYLLHVFSDIYTFIMGVNMTLDPSTSMGITPHNLYLYVLYQGGIILFTVCIIILLDTYIKSSKLSNYIKYGTISIIIMTFTEDYIALPIFWFYIFFISALYKHKIQQMQTNEGLQ